MITMPRFQTESEALKKALSIVTLGTSEHADLIDSHALFIVGDDLKLKSTDKDRIAYTAIPVLKTDEFDSISFTADPKKLIALINSTALDLVSFEYDTETKSLSVYASEDASSHLTFPSFDPMSFLSFDSDLSGAENIKSINAGLLIAGIKFIQGFLPNDEKDKKFSRLYINDGTLLGSNGSSKIGAFKSPDFEGLDAMIIRKGMLGYISQVANRIPGNIKIKSTDKFIVFTSEDENSGFGFLKTTDEQIKFPLSFEEPEADTIRIDRSVFMKRINRLALAGDNEMGIKASVGDALELSTMTDRVSKEVMPLTRIKGSDNFEFIFLYKMIKDTLSLFPSSEINLYIFHKECRMIIKDSGKLEISDKGSEPVVKEFSAISVVALARAI